MPSPAARSNPEVIQAGTPDTLERLTKLSPEQRNKALAGLPPARRAKIEQQLSDYQKMKPEERAKVLDRYNRMQALPPQKRAQVRASLQQFANLPQPRKAVVRRQLNQMKGLSDSDRRTMMNSEEFRSKFTASEQQMMADIASVTPEL
jgi:phage-related protein